MFGASGGVGCVRFDRISELSIERDRLASPLEETARTGRGQPISMFADTEGRAEKEAEKAGVHLFSCPVCRILALQFGWLCAKEALSPHGRSVKREQS